MTLLEILSNSLTGVIVGFLGSYIIYYYSKKDSNYLQKNIWKKEFDRYQTEPLIKIFKTVLLILDTNASTGSVKNLIPLDALNKLKIECDFIRYFNDGIKKIIREQIYHKCLEYNGLVCRINPKPNESRTGEINDNEQREEREKREQIEKSILFVMDEIKTIYSEI